MDFSAADRDLAIRTILGEEGSADGQAGVAAVILNRLAQGSYGRTLGDVILAPGQFEPWMHADRTDELLRIPRDDPRYVRAGQVLDGLSSGAIPDPTDGATHFYAPAAQRALGRAAPGWAAGEGQRLGATMFYAPQGRVRRPAVDAIEKARQQADDPGMREGLERLGAERALAASRAVPDRPPKFLADAVQTSAPPNRPPKFLEGAQPVPSWLRNYAEESLSEIRRAPGEIWTAAREGAGAEREAAAQQVAKGVAAMKTGQPLQVAAGAAADIAGTVRGVAAPLTGLAEGALYGLERSVDPQGLGVDVRMGESAYPSEDVRASHAGQTAVDAALHTERTEREGQGAVAAALHEPVSPPDRPPAFMPEAKPVPSAGYRHPVVPIGETEPSRISSDPRSRWTVEAAPQGLFEGPAPTLRKGGPGTEGGAPPERPPAFMPDAEPAESASEPTPEPQMSTGDPSDIARDPAAALRSGSIDTLRFTSAPTSEQIQAILDKQKEVERATIERIFGADADRVERLMRSNSDKSYDSLEDLAEKYGKEAEGFIYGKHGYSIIDRDSLSSLHDRINAVEFAVDDAARHNDYNELGKELAWLAPKLPDVNAATTKHTTQQREAVLALARAFEDMTKRGVDVRKALDVATQYTGFRVRGDAEDARVLLERLAAFTKRYIGEDPVKPPVPPMRQLEMSRPQAEPVDQTPKPLGAAASAPPAALPARPTREMMWGWEDNFNRLRKNIDADRSEFANYLAKLPQEIRNPEMMTKFFRRMENPNFPLAPAEQQAYEQYVAPLKREELKQWEEAKKTDLDVTDYDPTYAHRIVKGKASQLDRLTGYDPDNKFQIFGGGRSLPKSTSSMKERRFFAIQSETGERRIVARDDDGNLSELVGKDKYQPFASNVKLKVGDAFKHNGQTWTLEQARAHEVTTAGGPEYYENALVATIDNIMNLRQVNRAVYELNRLKSSPEWAAYAKPMSENAPPGWRESLMPVFRGYRLEPRLANVIDDFYSHREPGGLVDTLGKINRWAVGTMFWTPVAHGLNATSHWATARAWDWVNPLAYRDMAKTMSRAIYEVAGQGPKYQAMLREGNGLLFSSVANQQFYEKMLRTLGEQIVRQPSRWGPIADTLGVPLAALPKMLYEGSSRALWYWSDMLMMQRVLELEDKGMSLRDAVQEAERHIPSYRTRSEILGSRALAQAYFNPALTEFSRYHYDQINSWANIVKDITRDSKDPLGRSRRVEALGSLFATGVVGVALWPAIDAGYKKIFGPASKFGVRGAQTLAYPLMDKAMQTRWVKEHFPKYILDYYNGDADVVTTIINLYGLAPTTRMIAELTPITNFHDLFTGQNTIEPADIRAGRVGRVAGQAAEHIAEGMVQPYQVFQRARQGGKDVAKAYLEQATGGSEPNRAGRAKVFHRQEKEAERRHARPRGFLEGLFTRLPF